MAEIVCQNMKKSYGALEVVPDFNLHVNDHEFIVFLGPSGCGKSTALRLIAGLSETSAGRITWAEQKSAGDIGVVFQEPTLMPWATVAQNVFLPFKLRGMSYNSVKDEILEVLRQVGRMLEARRLI